MSQIASLIIGANSEIAKALVQQLLIETEHKLIVVSRDDHFYQQLPANRVKCFALDSYAEHEIISTIGKFTKESQLTFEQVFICNGLLHNNHCQPEKRLEDFDSQAFLEVVTANTITPMLWLKHLTPVLTGKSPCRIVIFTARVASISDNRLGGWYSYRASKAAMNMLIKSAAIELQRRAKNIKLISFHPGTTDSPLSKPFQKNVPEGKLFPSEFAAKQLLSISNNTEVDGQASYLDWQGKEIPW